MSANTVEFDAMNAIVEIAENQLTDAIVVAAKATKKPRATKKAVENTSPIVGEITANVAAGKYAIEAAANLTRIFGRTFDSTAEHIVTLANQLPADATATVTFTATPAPSAEPSVATPVLKKTRKTKAKVETPVAAEAEAPVAEEKPKKTRKPKAKAAEEPATEPAAEEPAKPKNARKAKVVDETVTVVEPATEPITEEAKPKKAATRKPRAKAEPKEEDTDSVGAIAEPKKKATKPRAKKTAEPSSADERPLVLVSPVMSEVTDETATFNNHLEVDDPELKGFTANWETAELVEEELSDIEE